MLRPIAKENQGTRTDLYQNSDKSLKPIYILKEVAKAAGKSHDTVNENRRR